MPKPTRDIQLETLEKRVFECSLDNNPGCYCPVSKKFRENTGERSIPEVYLGKPESRFMVAGINPGDEENYLPISDFDKYLEQVRGYWLKEYPKRTWVIYEYVANLFGYSLQNNEVIVTNLVHCPTKSWSKREGSEKWLLSEGEKVKAIDLCSSYLFDIIVKYKPKVIFVHGFDVIRSLSNHYNWGIREENLNSEYIQGKIFKVNDSSFVLSRHIASMQFSKGHKYWKRLEDAAKKLKNDP
jgi:hypothetical protein